MNGCELLTRFVKCPSVLLEKRMAKRLKDMKAFNSERAVMFNHFLIHGKSKIAQSWRNKKKKKRNTKSNLGL